MFICIVAGVALVLREPKTSEEQVEMIGVLPRDAYVMMSILDEHDEDLEDI